MIRVFDIRPILMLMINVALIFILYTINDLLSNLGISIIVPVLFFVVPSVYLNAPKALFVICATALLVESILPVRGFSILLIWLVAALLLRTQRFRFRRIKFLEVFTVLAVINTLVIFGYGLFFFSRNMDFLVYVFRVFNDAFFSVLFLVYSSSYVIFLHQRIFRILGLELNLEKEDLC